MPDPQRDHANVGPSNGFRTPLSLLGRARTNDGAAWEQLVKLYRPLVLFWCRRSGLGAPDVEDLSQEVFAAAFQGLSGFRHDRAGDTFRGWLRTITRNQILLHQRRNANKPQAAGGTDALMRLQEAADPLAGSEGDEEAEFGRVCRRVMELIKGEFEEATWQAF
jgi:RNA polymerase sigma-70 factor (ECF subfamily)